MKAQTFETGQVIIAHLDTGTLTVVVVKSELELERLSKFASRKNPKRGFLMVSIVMGKHYPAAPSTMRDIFRRLANRVPDDLPGPVLFVGLAETAICLGQGTYQEYVRKTGREDVLFLHTTRYRFDGRQVAVEFLEEHCHAPQHLVYVPDDPKHQALFAGARSVVFVDDEVTTGTTFVNLAAAFKQRNPLLEKALACVITDWRGEERTRTMNDRAVLPLEAVSILEGEAHFEPSPDLRLIPMPAAIGNGSSKSDIVSGNFGRFGIQLIPDVKERARALNIAPGKKCLLLGTGEFAYLPFLVAEELERTGVNVFCQSTTRSPAMVGGAIGCALTFKDNYEDDIANYVYNVNPDDYDVLVLCHETARHTLDEAMLAALGHPILMEF